MDVNEKKGKPGRKPVYSEERTPICLRIDKQLAEKLKSVASKNGKTVTDYIIGVLNEKVEFDLFKPSSKN